MTDAMTDAVSEISTRIHDDHTEVELPLPPGMVLGENGRPAFSETDSKCLDFFFQVVPSISAERLHGHCENAWAEDPKMALALIFQLGNVRKHGSGKQDRNSFYRAMVWLYENHPETFILNLAQVHEHASLKVLLDLLMFVMHRNHDGFCNLETSLKAKTSHDELRKAIRMPSVKKLRRKQKGERQCGIRMEFAESVGAPSIGELRSLKPEVLAANTKISPVGSRKWFAQTTWRTEELQGQWNAFLENRDRNIAAAAKSEAQRRWHREEARAQLQSSAANNVQRVFAAVADIFADGLKEELATAKAGKPISGLFGKWAPSPKRRHDKATGLVDAIILRLFDGQDMECDDAESLRLRRRIRYQTEVLSYLRGQAKVPEHFVGSGAWGEVDYWRMPSRCRLLYGAKLFGKHDRRRYVEFLREAASKSLASAALLPHEVTRRAYERAGLSGASAPARCGPVKSTNGVDDIGKMEDKLFWQSLVKGCAEARAHGDLGWMVPVCDVSGSMSGEPMDVAVALSLLLAQAQADSPWRGRIFTFHSTPQLVEVPMLSDAMQVSTDGEDELEALPDVGEMVKFVRGLEWGINTNIDALFDQLLERSVAEGLSAEHVGRMALAIFSDMEFDAARHPNVPWETAHEAICRRFGDAGFPQPPVIIYWNLRASRSTPVQRADQPGVILMSGFSAGLLRGLLSGNAATEEQLENEEADIDIAAEVDAPGQPDRPKVTPYQRMKMTLSNPLYAALQVAPQDQVLPGTATMAA